MFFGLFSKKEQPTITTDLSAHPFYPIYDVGQAFSYVGVEFNGKNLNMSLTTKTVSDCKFALEEVDLLKKTIQTVKKEITLQISELRSAHADRVANRGVMMPGGGKLGTAFRYLERASRASQRGEVSSTIKAVQEGTIAPLNTLLLACDKMKLMLKKEILAG
jgi:hypothetical protein